MVNSCMFILVDDNILVWLVGVDENCGSFWFIYCYGIVLICIVRLVSCVDESVGLIRVFLLIVFLISSDEILVSRCECLLVMLF